MDVLFLGHIEGIKYTQNSVIVIASERRKGYKKKDGTIVGDELLTFSFVFKPYFKKFISEHFAKGVLVKIKGIMLPYAKDADGNITTGYSIIGQTIDVAPYQTRSIKVEKKMINESAVGIQGTPDPSTFEANDF